MRPSAFTKEQLAFGLWGFGFILAFIIGYSAYAAFPYLAGPSLTINARTAENGVTNLLGTTKRVSFLEINGDSVPLEEDGTYSAVRAFPPGYTAVEAVARDRFGRNIRNTLSFVITQSSTTYGAKKED